MSDAEAKETVAHGQIWFMPTGDKSTPASDPYSTVELAEQLLNRVRADFQSAKNEPDPVEAFYAAVNARAEAAMMGGKPIEGAHHRALEHEIREHRKKRDGK